jgi:hypothetical protein
MRPVLGVVVAALLTIPRMSLAQTAARPSDEPRFFVDVNLFGTAASAAQSRGFISRFLAFGELGSFRATYPPPSRANLFPLQDVGGGVMFGHSLGIGVNYNRTEYEDAVAIAATIPHPVLLNAASSGTGVTDEALTRREASTNVFVVFAPVRMDRAEFRIFGGPTFFACTADMVRDVLYTQAFDPSTPLNAITITGFTRGEAKSRAMGFHVGGDLTYFLSQAFGVGGGVRFSRGTVTVDKEPMSKLSQDIRVGGALVFLGVRLRFGG